MVGHDRCGVRAWELVWDHLKGDGHVPTLTAVLPSSSDARLPPGLLLILMRLLLRGVRITALIGRGAGPVGDAGGETVISPGETTPGGQNKGGLVEMGGRGQSAEEKVTVMRRNGGRGSMSRLWRVRWLVKFATPLNFWGGGER